MYDTRDPVYCIVLGRVSRIISIYIIFELYLTLWNCISRSPIPCPTTTYVVYHMCIRTDIGVYIHSAKKYKRKKNYYKSQ